MRDGKQDEAERAGTKFNERVKNGRPGSERGRWNSCSGELLIPARLCETLVCLPSSPGEGRHAEGKNHKKKRYPKSAPAL